jgi:hypothetical protein
MRKITIIPYLLVMLDILQCYYYVYIHYSLIIYLVMSCLQCKLMENYIVVGDHHTK